MELMDKVERLRERAGVTYEEAKAVLEETDGDLLEAMILLERRGRLDPPAGETQREQAEPQRETPHSETHDKAASAWQAFWTWIKSLIARGNRNTLQIRRHDNVIGAVPVTIFVLAAVFAFWVIAVLLIIGLFCGCSYSFAGPDLGRDKINRAWDKASKVAETIKEDFRKEVDSARDLKNK